MTNAPTPVTVPDTLDVLPQDQLAAVTGGGIGTDIGRMFGAEGAKWGGIADQFIGMIGQFKGLSGG